MYKLNAVGPSRLKAPGGFNHLYTYQVISWFQTLLSNAACTATDGCCQRADCNGLWRNGESTEDDWIAVLAAVSARYRAKPNVVGLVHV
jgi:hypothetical protein